MDDTGIEASGIDDMDTDSCGEKALHRQRRALEADSEVWITAHF